MGEYFGIILTGVVAVVIMVFLYRRRDKDEKWEANEMISRLLTISGSCRV